MGEVVNGMRVAELNDRPPFSPAELIPNKPIVWEQTGEEENPRSRLHASVHLFGVFMHLEAWEVREYDTPEYHSQEVVAYTTDFDPLYELCGVAAFETLEIEGRQYVVICTPGER